MSGSSAIILSNRSYPTPSVASTFARSAFDWQTLSTLSSMPTGGSISRAGHAMLYDSTGKLTYAPNNLLLNSATLSTQSVTTAAINYILSFKGTGSVALSGAYSGSLAGTSASNRVSLAFTSTAASLTLTVTGSVTEAQLEAVTYQTTPSTYIPTTTSAYYGPRLDYDPSTLAFKGLLVEGSRTNLTVRSEDFSVANWVKSNATIATNTDISPDGTTTADTVTATAANGEFYQQVTSTSGTAHTGSIFVKRKTGTGSVFLIDAAAVRKLVTASISSSSWTRISVTANSATVNPFFGLRLATSGDELYVWGAQFELGAFATSYIPTTSATVTRAAETMTLPSYASQLVVTNRIDEQTGATYYDNIAPGATFTPNSGWISSLRVYTGASAGTQAVPSWLDNSGTTGNRMYYDSTGTLTWAAANMLLNSATLSTQTVTVTSGATNILSFYGTGSITYSGAASGTLSGTGANDRVSVVLTMTTASLTLTVSGSVTQAQLERVTYQTQPRAYIPTTSAAVYQPRFDYDPSVTPATPKGMLIEESRVNLFTYSEQFNDASYTKNAVSVSADAIISPSGVVTADFVIPDTTSAVHRLIKTATCSSSTSYATSVFVRAGGYSKVAFVENGTTGAYASFDLSGSGSVISTGSGGTGSITRVGNGWYRIVLVATTGAAQTSWRTDYYVLPNSYTSGVPTASWAGDGVSGVYLWGAQLEAGAFATSYIPTVAAAVTRVADSVYISGSSFSSIWNASKGSIVSQVVPSVVGARGVFSVNNGTVNNRMDARINGAAVVTDGGVGQATIGIPLFTNYTVGRVAFAYEVNNFAAVANGGTVGTDTLGTVPTVNRFQFGSFDANPAYNLCGHVQSFAYYNQRLPDATLKSKSTVGAPL